MLSIDYVVILANTEITQFDWSESLKNGLYTDQYSLSLNTKNTKYRLNNAKKLCTFFFFLFFSLSLLSLFLDVLTKVFFIAFFIILLARRCVQNQTALTGHVDKCFSQGGFDLKISCILYFDKHGKEVTYWEDHHPYIHTAG